MQVSLGTAQMIPSHRLKLKDPSMPKEPQLEELEQ